MYVLGHDGGLKIKDDVLQSERILLQRQALYDTVHQSLPYVLLQAAELTDTKVNFRLSPFHSAVPSPSIRRSTPTSTTSSAALSRRFPPTSRLPSVPPARRSTRRSRPFRPSRPLPHRRASTTSFARRPPRSSRMPPRRRTRRCSTCTSRTSPSSRPFRSARAPSAFPPPRRTSWPCSSRSSPSSTRA